MKNKSIIATVIIGILFFVAIAYSTFLFNNTVNQELEKSTRTTLVDLANQQQLSLDRQLENMIFSLVSVAEALPIIGINENEILEYINTKKEVLNLESVMVIDKDGLAMFDDGSFVDLSKEEFFIRAINDDEFASTPHYSEYLDKEVVTVAVPIYVDGKVDGVLAVDYCIDYLATLLTTFTDTRGLNLIIDQNGEIIVSTNSFVISFDAFKNAQFEDGVTFDSIIADFKNGNSGSISYSINGVDKLGEYRPIAINDWILFFEISEESLVTSVQNISRNMLLISGLIVAFAFVSILYIIIQKNNASRVLEQAAYYDELTGIPNLLKFKMLVAEEVAKNPDKKHTMVKMDLVNFKAINEMFGFKAGNKVICAIADIGKTVPNSSFIQARVGAEEFMFFSESELFENLNKSSRGYEERFKSLLPEFEDHQFSFRYGRYFIQEGETDVNIMVNKANIAHSFAKKDGTSNIWNYDEAFTKKVLKDTEIANKMHKALDHEEFKVFLQPKCNVNTGKIKGAEALVRWIESNGNMVFPNEFIPLFEQNGFIVELDKYMLKGVCSILRSYIDRGIECLPISVNFSRLHIQNPNFVKEIADIVISHGVETKYIDIELTESTVMENGNQLRTLLKDLHKAGFLVSIDDFGSGYSSLGMLKNFKVDTLKLDRSFFVDFEEEDEYGRGNLVVESVVKLAGKLNMYTVAEGIEDQEQLEFLQRINCDAAQGYYFSKPVPLVQFDKMYLNQDKIKTEQ